MEIVTTVGKTACACDIDVWSRRKRRLAWRTAPDPIYPSNRFERCHAKVLWRPRHGTQSVLHGAQQQPRVQAAALMKRGASQPALTARGDTRSLYT